MAKRFELSDASLVGIKNIDEEHAQIINLLNEIADAIDSHLPKETVARMLDSFNSFVKFHFFREEVIMKVIGFTAFHDHATEHNMMLKALKDTCDTFLAKEKTDYDCLFALVSGWNVNHIAEEDVKIKTFIQENLRSVRTIAGADKLLEGFL